MTEMDIKGTKAKLVAAGWEYILSVTYTQGHGTRYGLLFAKDGQKFYLNKETYNSLPI